MFRLNLTIALRNLFKNKVYSLINILGLSIGMASCILIFVFISFQLSFDKGLETQSWLISASISTSLLAAFGIASLMKGTRYDNLTPYVDPLILATLTAFLIFVPMAALRDALRDMFRIAPFELDEKIRGFLDMLTVRYGFKTYTSYVVKIGRAKFIEIHIVVPPGYPISGVEALDAIRREIVDVLGGNGPALDHHRFYH